MLKPIRRVVTGHNAEGRSIIVSDKVVESAFEVPVWPGRGVTAVWTSNEAPASNRDEDMGEASGFPLPGSGGVSFMIMQIPPESELEKMSPEDRAIASVPVARTFPEAMEIDISKSYQMHATDTIDYLIMLSGELTLLVDDGEVTLKPFDTVIQRGVNHGWINHGTEPALIMSAVIDAKPLERKRKPQKKGDAAKLWE